MQHIFNLMVVGVLQCRRIKKMMGKDGKNENNTNDNLKLYSYKNEIKFTGFCYV